MKEKFARVRAFFKDIQIKPLAAVLWLLAAAAVVSAAVALGRLAPSKEQLFPVYITEILASNTAYPNKEGRCCDFIELHNGADYPVDLSGFQMGDIAGKSRYAFPEGTVLEPGGYYTVYCDKTVQDGAYAPFEINRSGGETFCLIAENGAVVDQVTTLALEIDQAMVWVDGSWQCAGIATPGRANETAGSYENVYNPAISPVTISEFSVEDTGYLAGYGLLCDWVELYNSGDEPADLSGYTLSDNMSNNKYTFPEGTALEPGGYRIVYCTDRVADPACAPFGLSTQVTETLVLKDRAGLIAAVVRTQAGVSAMARDEQGNWAATDTPTPGYENTAQGHTAFLTAIGATPGSIRISEVCSSRQAALADAFGAFPDWVELHNTTEQTVDLSGWCLSDDPALPQKWMIPSLILEPDQRVVIFCSGKDTQVAGELHAGFGLSAEGESLTLSAYTGSVVDAVTFPGAADHESFTFDQTGAALQTALSTPGYPNDPEGYEAFCDSVKPRGSLAIWEVMTSNDTYAPQRLGACYDWVELRNVSDEPLDLEDFSLSDDPEEPGIHLLKSQTLAPGGSMLVILSDEPGVAKDGCQQALFTLNARSDQLFLFDPEGNLLDYVYLDQIPAGCSYGRSEDAGGFGYMEPTPENPNRAGYRLISAIPQSSYEPGVYVQEEGFEVELTARGEIYYTTDGSAPSEKSSRYEKPLKIRENTVIRAVAVEAGKLTSEIYTATFLVEEQNLPVVSLVTDPDGLWGINGVYTEGDPTVKEVQLPAHVSYSGDDGSFALNCRTNLHGATSVVAFPKKSFAVRFEDVCDGPLNYDVFEDGEVTTFRSLIIRNAYESTFSSQMHDSLIATLAHQGSERVLTQKCKYVAFYLNGEYWGLYAIRERHSAEHYASYMDVPADSVSIVRFAIDEWNSLQELYRFCEVSNFLSDENYAYAKSVIDVESFADWIIYEAYMCNVDINSNIRYYYSTEDGLWRMGLADVDLGIVGSSKAFDEVKGTFHHGRLVRYLMANEDFQDLLATRLAQLLEGPLSDEHVLATIDEMAATIRPEIPKDAQRWSYPVSGWEWTVTDMKNFCDGRAKEMIDSLCEELGFTRQERAHYFGHLE